MNIKAKVEDNRFIRMLYEYGGLLQTKLKVPIHDNFLLSAVYSPGVGQPCLEIQKNYELAYTYTNMSNNIALLTDATNFPYRSDPRWQDYAAVPILEATSLFFKRIGNVDAFPFLLHQDCKTEEHYKNVIFALSGSCAGIQLFKMCKENEAKVINGLKEKEKDLKSFIITSKERDFIEKNLQECGLGEKINTSFYVVILSRALLDSLYRGFINPQLLELLFQHIEPQLFVDNPLSYLYNHSLNIYTKLIDKVFELNLQNTQKTKQELINRFHNYLILGGKSWYEKLDINYSKDRSSNDISLELHKCFYGVMHLSSKVKLNSDFKVSQLVNKDIQEYLTLKCLENPNFYKENTMKHNWCAIITNGTAILGFGDIGATAGMPVMEGKSCIFKSLGDVDVVPMCIQEKDPLKLIEVIHHLSPIFSAINLEDIKAPECFQVEAALKEKVDFPIFHDDQHGTAIVVVSGIINSLRLTKKQPKDMKVLVNGGGAAGLTITKLLLKIGIENIIVCDTKGAIYEGRKDGMNEQKDQMALITNKDKIKGNLQEVIKGVDIFVGVSAGGALKKEWIPLMNKKPIIFALANPIPEIYPQDAYEMGAEIVGTGRADYPNQINNSLAFPGIFRGILDSEASTINIEMKLAAAQAIASLVSDEQLNAKYIIPNSLDPKVALSVASSVAETAFSTGVARRKNIDLNTIKRRMARRILGQVPEPGNYGPSQKL